MLGAAGGGRAPPPLVVLRAWRSRSEQRKGLPDAPFRSSYSPGGSGSCAREASLLPVGRYGFGGRSHLFIIVCRFRGGGHPRLPTGDMRRSHAQCLYYVIAPLLHRSVGLGYSPSYRLANSLEPYGCTYRPMQGSVGYSASSGRPRWWYAVRPDLEPVPVPCWPSIRI